MTIQHIWPNDLAREGDIKIEVVGGEDPTEYAMTVAVEYAKDVLVLRLSYYLERIAHPLASRIADAFAAVVCNFIEGSEELVPSVVCKLAQDPAEATHFPQALKYWQEKMQSFVDVSTFPAAPNRLYKVDLTSSASIQIDLPPAGGRISTSTLLRASWALILSRQSASDRIVFGVMTDGKVGGRGIRIGNMTGKAGSTAAVVPYAVHSVHNQWHGMLPFMHADMDRVRSVCPGADAACGFQNLLMVQDDGRCPGEGKAGLALSKTSNAPEHQFQHAIHQLASNYSAVLLDLVSMSTHEMSLLGIWNAQAATAVEDCVHDQFRQVARRQPEMPAVCSWDQELSYEQLDDLSEHFATRLERAGVKAETVVPFVCEKSATAVVIMLGILKAGGAFLFLHLSHPAGRLRSILCDAGASLVVASPALSDSVENFDLKVITLDISAIGTLSKPHGISKAAVRPTNACYVIYTSGSTGGPKGIVVSHSNLATSAASHRHRLGMTTQTRTMQLVSFAFDVAVGDVIMTLLSGGCLCMPTETERTDDIPGAIRRTRANFLWATPTLATLLTPSGVPTLRTLALIGEPMRKEI
ncbi:hypothetical protein LTR37_014408 [Vermiconidia calcicola]|uniref:Uncharacterized protein n=1 Tax=Vermiconidia calcicola TaxID=1690605 RepID=A0ACC3MTU7_9PEZI|nr:hypothetical protein LTR37_014408 [Vermiconidia calcicola]